MISSTTFMGRLCADPELQFTPQGKGVCTFRLAQNVKPPPDSGAKERARFVTVKVWDGWAGNLCKTTKKGNVVVVSGSLDYEEWKDRDSGDQRSRVLINARECYHVELVFAEETAPAL